MSVQQKLETKNLNYAKKGIIWGVIGGILYGFVANFQTMAMESEPLASGEILGLLAVPFVVGCLQDLMAGVWVLIPNIKNGKHKDYWRVLNSKPGKYILVCALAGGLVASTGFMTGVYLAGPVYPVAISATFPAIGAVLSRIFLKEKISVRGWIGILMCVTGAIVISWVPPSGDTYPHFYLGIFAALFASIGWSLEGVISSAGMDFVDPEIALGIRQFASGTTFFIALLFVAGFGFKAYALWARTIPTIGFVYIIIAGFASGIGYYYYYKANNACGASRGMALNILYSVVAAVLGFILGSAITWTFVVGLIVLLLGCVLVIGKPSDLLSLRDVN